MPLRDCLRTLIPESQARRHARASSFQLRQRRLDLAAFLWTLVLGFGAGGPRSYTGLYEIYLGVARRSLSESAFFEWLGKAKFGAWARLLVEHAIERLERDAPRRLSGVLGQFRDLFVADATVLQVAHRLARRFPAANSLRAPAALKVHVLQKGGGGNLHKVSVTEGKRSESRVFRLGPWIKGALLLMDLGYYRFQRFARIKQLGGFFVSRVKSGTNPIIKCIHRTHRGRAIPVVGERLQDVLGRLQRQVLDVEVEVDYQARSYKGKRPGKTLTLRLVGLWYPGERRYRLFFTNLSPDQASAQEVADLYRLRWQVELFFKELKSVYKLDDLPGARPETVEAMAYFSVLSALVTRRLIRELEARHDFVAGKLTDGQAAKIIQRHALALLEIALRPTVLARPEEKRLERTLRSTLRRRCKKRPNLRTELQELQGHPELERRAA